MKRVSLSTRRASPRRAEGPSTTKHAVKRAAARRQPSDFEKAPSARRQPQRGQADRTEFAAARSDVIGGRARFDSWLADLATRFEGAAGAQALTDLALSTSMRTLAERLTPPLREDLRQCVRVFVAPTLLSLANAKNEPTTIEVESPASWRSRADAHALYAAAAKAEGVDQLRDQAASARRQLERELSSGVPEGEALARFNAVYEQTSEAITARLARAARVGYGELATEVVPAAPRSALEGEDMARVSSSRTFIRADSFGALVGSLHQRSAELERAAEAMLVDPRPFLAALVTHARGGGSETARRVAQATPSAVADDSMLSDLVRLYATTRGVKGHQTFAAEPAPSTDAEWGLVRLLADQHGLEVPKARDANGLFDFFLAMERSSRFQ